MDNNYLKTIVWIGSSLNDLKELPPNVQREIGFTLHLIQEGKTPYNTKSLKGFDPGVLEIISDFNKNTYRAIYAIKLDEDIYVLHVFQKKSKHGIATPKKEIDLIRQRLLVAKENAKKNK